MKKFLVMIIVSAFTVSMVEAQEGKSDKRESTQFGLKAGFNHSNMYDSKTQDFSADPKFGFAGGLYLAVPLGKYVGFQPELLYSEKGFKGSGIILGNSYSFTRSTHYIDVPLLIAIKPASMITILAGPQFSYLLSQKDVFDNSTYSATQQQEFNNDNLRKNVFCFIGGLDFNFKSAVLGTRVGWDIQNNNGDGTSNTPRYKNVWFQATLGINLGD